MVIPAVTGAWADEADDDNFVRPRRTVRPLQVQTHVSAPISVAQNPYVSLVIEDYEPAPSPPEAIEPPPTVRQAAFNFTPPTPLVRRRESEVIDLERGEAPPALLQMVAEELRPSQGPPAPKRSQKRQPRVKRAPTAFGP